MNRFAYSNPATLTQAAANSGLVAEAMVTQEAGTVLKAGGIDLLDLLKSELLAPAVIVNLRALPGLGGIAEDASGGLHIGATATLSQIAEHPLVRGAYPALATAVAGSASPQLRNAATIGGNLLQRPHCWYFRSASYHCLRKGGGHCFAIHGENQYHAIFDNRACAIVHPSTPATALVALKAEVELRDALGGGRRLLLEDFLVGPDDDMQRENALRPREVLTSVLLPRPAAGTRMAHLRQGEKAGFDWPLADVAVVLRLDPDGSCREAAVVLGAAAPVPYRARAAEQALVGRRIDDAAARDAAKAGLHGATPLSRNAYKLPLFETLVRRAILAAA
jgi:xanthine dehydrogenase YagS FAD-binding subunit